MVSKEGRTKMKVYVYKVYGDYDESDDVTKVFDSRKKAQEWHRRMKELVNLHNEYHKDGTVDRSGGSTDVCPEIIKLRKEAGSENYTGEIVELELE